jgi:hypothetical protein
VFVLVHGRKHRTEFGNSAVIFSARARAAASSSAPQRSAPKAVNRRTMHGIGSVDIGRSGACEASGNRIKAP